MNNSNYYPWLKKIGAAVRKHRIKHGLSQFQLGLEVGKSANQIGRIERGESNPTIVTLFTLADFFQINVTDFF